MTKNAKIAIISGVAALALISGLVLVQQMSQTDANANQPANVPVGTNQPVNEPAVDQPVNEPVNEPVSEPVPATTTKGNSDIIRVTSPKQGDQVVSPLEVTGEARGNWYFEATFPLKLVDRDGNTVATGYAQAEGEWMTTEYVPFKGTITFETPASPTGQLILEKSNASGLPEHDDSYIVAVRYAQQGAGGTELTGCRRTGCSGQLCAEEDLVTTCEFREEYACYKDAKCERQASGLCGWTPEPQLLSCLAGKQQ